MESITSLTKSSGGFVALTNIQSSYNNRLSGSIEVGVPAASFENSLAGIKASGKVKSVSTQGQDVTEEYVDLQVRQTSYQNQLAQYNAIMKQSQKVEDIIAVNPGTDRPGPDGTGPACKQAEISQREDRLLIPHREPSGAGTGGRRDRSQFPLNHQ